VPISWPLWWAITKVFSLSFSIRNKTGAPWVLQVISTLMAASSNLKHIAQHIDAGGLCRPLHQLRGARPIWCDSYSWNWVGMCFVTLLVFKSERLHATPSELRLDVSKSTLGTVTNVACMMSWGKRHVLFNAFAWKCAIWWGTSQNNLIILLWLI